MMYQPDNLRRTDGIKDHFEHAQKMSEKIFLEKSQTLSNTYDEMKSFLKDLEDLKLSNEQLERVIEVMEKERSEIDESRKTERKSYELLVKKYQEVKKLLENSHNENMQLSNIVEKMRENEKQLLMENERLRKSGSNHEKKSLKEAISFATIDHLEHELKHWKEEANRLSLMFSKVDQNSDQNAPSKTSVNSIRKKAPVNPIKHNYNPILLRSKSVENSVKKTKDSELTKLKQEKAQMKDLLNNLESQVVEIQNNITRINEERQKYKDLYFECKHQLDHLHCLCSKSDKRIEELGFCNSQLDSELNKYREEFDHLLAENNQLKSINVNLINELNTAKDDATKEIDRLKQTTIQNEQENSELEGRSKQLRQNVHNLEKELSQLEEKLHEKDEAIKYNMKLLDSFQSKHKISEEEINKLNERIQELSCALDRKQTIIQQMKDQELTDKDKYETQDLELHKLQDKINDLTNHLDRQQSSLAAQSVKFDNHLSNAEQIISCKIKLIANLELKLSNLEHDHNQLNDELLEYKSRINSKEHQLEIANNKYQESQESKQFLEKHIKSITNSSESLQKEIIHLNSVINDMKSQLDSAYQELDGIQTQLKEAEGCCDYQHQTIKRLESTIKSNEEEIRRLNTKFTQSSTEKREKDSYITSLVCVVEEKEKRLQNLQQQLEDNDNKIRQLSSRVNEYEDHQLQSTSRGTALELELDKLRSANSRFKRQMDQLNCDLTERNLLIGQLESQLKWRLSTSQYTSQKETKINNQLLDINQ